MGFLINYIMIGFLVGFLLEYSVDKLTKESFTTKERIFVILLWPLSLFTFIVGFFSK